jgi:hypothetical protein
MIDEVAARRGVFLPKLVTTLREGYGPAHISCAPTCSRG